MCWKCSNWGFSQMTLTAGRARALFMAFDEATHRYAFKQMEYANKRNVPYVVVVGSEEMANGQYTLKNMQTGEQERVGMAGLLSLRERGRE
jgi:histidyl-tRNA synthetase